MAIEYGNGKSIGDLRMIPMEKITWDAFRALPDDTQVFVVHVHLNPMLMAVQFESMSFDINDVNRQALQEHEATHPHDLPQIVIYSLPPVEVPEPEEFATTTPRKDADSE